MRGILKGAIWCLADSDWGILKTALWCLGSWGISRADSWCQLDGIWGIFLSRFAELLEGSLCRQVRLHMWHSAYVLVHVQPSLSR